MDTEKILLDRLKNEFGYPDYMLTNTVAKIMAMNPELKKDFDTWFEKGILSDRIIEGYTLAKLVSDYGMNTVGAFLTMDWLVREPDFAKKALQSGIK